MGDSITRKIIRSHLVSGSMKAGEDVFLKVDHTLTHDINAVMTYLAFEAIGMDRIGILADIHEPEMYENDDSMIIGPLPPEEAKRVPIIKGPNIAFLPVPEKPDRDVRVQISLKGHDNISTDDITPASAEFSSMRSNIPLMSKYCYHRYDPEFAERARAMGKSIIIGGENYGQGSSREHAAINPMYLGVRAVIAKSIARIHRGNLINHGIVPMLFEGPADYDKLEQEDYLVIGNFPAQIEDGRVKVTDENNGYSFYCRLDLSDAEKAVILDGGQLRHLQEQLKEMGKI